MKLTNLLTVIAAVPLGFGLAYIVPISDETQQVCYETDGELVKPEYEAELIGLRVNLYDTVEQITAATGEKDIEGLASFERLSSGVVECEIWASRPRIVLGDAAMDTLGHELLHCISGEFHE